MKAGRAFPPTALAVTIVSIVGVSIALAAGELVPDSLPPVSPIILPKTPETTGASPTTDPTPISVGISAVSSNTTPLGTTPGTTNASVAAPPSVGISPTAPNSEPIPQPPQSTTVHVVPPSAPVPTSKPAQADAGSDNDDGEDDSSEDDDEPDESED